MLHGLKYVVKLVSLLFSGFLTKFPCSSQKLVVLSLLVVDLEFESMSRRGNCVTSPQLSPGGESLSKEVAGPFETLDVSRVSLEMTPGAHAWCLLDSASFCLSDLACLFLVVYVGSTASSHGSSYRIWS